VDSYVLSCEEVLAPVHGYSSTPVMMPAALSSGVMCAISFHWEPS